MKPSRIAFEHHWVKVKGKRARNDLQRHPAQPETYISDAANRHWVTWQAAQPKEPEQEPVAHIDMSEWPPVRFKEGTLRCDIAHLDGQKLYTTPPQRKPLTDGCDEFKRYIEECDKCAINPDVAGAFNAGWQAAHNIKE